MSVLRDAQLQAPTFSSPRRPHTVMRPTLAALACALLLAACGAKNEAAPAGAGGGMPPPEVGVVTVTPSTVGLVNELPGRLEASRLAQVRARTAGILQKRLFTEGSDVKAGQPLFQIDNATYRAAVESAEASVAQAEASVAQASGLVQRYRPLVELNAISKQDYDNAVATQRASEANVAAAKAALTVAQINLGYATVTAPIGGRIGRALVTEGALVGQGTPTQLALIQQINPLYVNFTQSAADALKLRAQMASGKYQSAGANAAKVSVILEDGSTYTHTGKLLFTDLSVDPTSGQVTLRAEVPNPERLLFPGLYVRVQLEQARFEHALLVPQQAVTRNSQGDTVLVVAADGSFAPRPVQVGPSQGSNWIITGGLNAGDQVIVDGVMKLRPGVTKVNAVPYTEKSGPGAAPAAAASGAAPAASGASAAPAATAASQPASAASAN